MHLTGQMFALDSVVVNEFETLIFRIIFNKKKRKGQTAKQKGIKGKGKFTTYLCKCLVNPKMRKCLI